MKDREIDQIAALVQRLTGEHYEPGDAKVIIRALNKAVEMMPPPEESETVTEA